MHIVDVPGERRRRVAGTSSFSEELRSLPAAPLDVTLRFEPNEAKPYGISAYVDDMQIGYLQTEWTADDPHVQWMMQLHKAGICPRFEGWADDEGAWRSVDFMMPHRDELSAAADWIISRVQ